MVPDKITGVTPISAPVIPVPVSERACDTKTKDSGVIKFRINQDLLIEHSCILGMRS